MFYIVSALYIYSLLPKLTKLDLNYCSEIEALNFHSKSLHVLKLNSCESLKKLSVMPQETTKQIMSSQEIDLRGNVESLSSNMKNLPMLNDCMDLISLSKLPLFQLVLQHMLQSLIPYLHQQHLNDPNIIDNDYFFFRGGYFIEECGFQREEKSITIPYLPKSDLLGFVSCIIISYRPLRRYDDGDDDDDYLVNHGKNDKILINIYQDGIQVCQKKIDIDCGSEIISYHTLFSYLDVSQFDRSTETYDHLTNIKFTFELYHTKPDQDRIQEYGVFPIYATTSGLKLLGRFEGQTCGP